MQVLGALRALRSGREQVTKEAQSDFHYCTRLTPQTRLPSLSASNLGRSLVINRNARRRASRMRLLETSEPIGEGRRSDKEARDSCLITVRDSDLINTAPSY